MPRRSRIRIGALEDLAAQLRFAPRGAALRQIEQAEKLAQEIEPARTYAEDWVAWRITGYRRAMDDPALLVGEALIGDLSAFVERLSEESRLERAELGEGVLTLDDLCARWNVSRKSIERYRRLGLLGIRVRDGSSSVSLVFRLRMVEAFERKYPERLKAAAEFRRLDADERRRVQRMGARLARGANASASAAAARIAPRVGRGRETIRRRLLTGEGKPAEAPFIGAGALDVRERLVIWRAHRWGVGVGAIAARFHRSRASVHRVINERRAELLRRLDLSGPVAPDFLGDARVQALLEEPDVCQGLGSPGEASVGEFATTWRDARAMDARRERRLAEAYCLLKFRAARVIAALPRSSPGSRALDEAETLLRWGALVKVELARGQAGLALRSIEERIGPVEEAGAPGAALIGEAMSAVCRAIDQFDPFRSGRLAASTSLALARVLASAEGPMPRQAVQARRTARADVPLADWARAAAEWNSWLAAHSMLRAGAARLKPPLGEAVECRFGLSGGRPMNRAELEARFGLTEAQIERATAMATRLARRHGSAPE